MQAAARAGIEAELVPTASLEAGCGRADPTLGRFDAPFIRDIASVEHPTYRIVRYA